MPSPSKPCALCATAGGDLLWQGEHCRIVRVNEEDYPGFCRVIWGTHVREMTDLPPTQRDALMRIVLLVEEVVRRLFKPHKINLASFGNVVPHLHWHIIPRWEDDRHFPEPIWGSVQRTVVSPRPVVSNASLSAALDQAMQQLAH